MPRLLSIILDLACVLAFAAIGRASHAEALDPTQLGRTAAPFVAACLMAQVLLIMRPGIAVGWWRQGLVVWASTVVLGMIFRTMVGQGVQVSFVVVAATALAIGLIGWRAIASRLRPQH